MKTIFATVFHGHIARNILRTDVLPLLSKDPEVRLVLLVPDFKRDFYAKEFGQVNVVVEGIPTLRPTKLDSFFRSIYFFFVNSETVKILQGTQFLVRGKYIRYYTNRLLTNILGRSRFLRNIVRLLDKFLIKDTSFGSLFEKYKPDLVFIGSVTSDQDSMVLRAAKARNIYSVAMVRSWDNFSVNKGNIRIFPEKLLVHNRYLQDDAVNYADMSHKDTILVGMSHFDFYINRPRMSREELGKRVGFDATKPFIFFLLIGISAGDLDAHVTKHLERLIQEDPVLKDFQLIVRPHPNTDKPLDFAGPKTIVNTPKIIDFVGGRLADREFTSEDMEIYASLIHHSAVIVSYQGTGSIDCAALDRPVINIAYDPFPKPYLESMRHQYDYTHYRPIRATGGVKVVWKEEDLREALLDYIIEPTKDTEYRKILVSDQCYLLDGKSSERTAQAILSFL